MSTKEKLENLVKVLKRWQRVEDATLSMTAKIVEETDNALIRQVMEIIQYDSIMHHRVQQLIVDSVEKTPVNVSPDDLDKVWTLIEKHNKIENESVGMAEECIESLTGTKNPVPLYLLNYLKEDEQKHANLLESLSLIKKGMYP